jgi:hypothetical protein
MTLGGDGGDTSKSPNFISSMKKYHSRLKPSNYATYGMLGKKQSDNQKKKVSEKNSCPVICNNIEYASVGLAEQAYPGIKIRYRLDNPKFPDFYRLKEKVKR